MISGDTWFTTLQSVCFKIYGNLCENVYGNNMGSNISRDVTELSDWNISGDTWLTSLQSVCFDKNIWEHIREHLWKRYGQSYFKRRDRIKWLKYFRRHTAPVSVWVSPALNSTVEIFHHEALHNKRLHSVRFSSFCLFFTTSSCIKKLFLNFWKLRRYASFQMEFGGE